MLCSARLFSLVGEQKWKHFLFQPADVEAWCDSPGGDLDPPGSDPGSHKSKGAAGTPPAASGQEGPPAWRGGGGGDLSGTRVKLCGEELKWGGGGGVGAGLALRAPLLMHTDGKN